MKWLSILIIFMAALLISLSLMSNHARDGFTEGGLLSIGIAADKSVYHSSEEMELTSTIGTDTRVGNLTIRVYGIKDRGGRYRINGERLIDIAPPGKTETFTFSMPSCYGCAGVSPGEYEITMEIIRNNETIGNDSVTVVLES